MLKVTPTPELNDWHLQLRLLFSSIRLEQRHTTCTPRIRRYIRPKSDGLPCKSTAWEKKKVFNFRCQTFSGRSMMNLHSRRWMPLARVYHRPLGIHIFNIYVSATFSSCYEKLIFLLTLLQKDMSLCAPIQDNQVILVHMPPHISPPAPWPLSSAKSYLPSGLYGVSTRS